MPVRLTPAQWLQAALLATLAFRFWLAAAAPVTADEAYFILWGRHPDIGYYDHPPMVGWWLAPLAAISEAGWLMRLPAVLVPPAVALLVRAVLRRWYLRDADTADLAALAVLLLPMNVWNVLITTDTPLVLFSVASLLAFARAAERRSDGLFLVSGLLLGFAFLSKYFAVLLGVAYAVWAVASRQVRGPLLVFLAALPAGLLNLYWNVEACWCNVMFNAINRHDEGDAGWSATTPALYLLSLAYLAGPFAWLAWRERGRLAESWREPGRRALLLAWLVPLAVFALLSPVKRIGLHWLLSFLPPLVVTLALVLDRRALSGAVKLLAGFALLHMAVIGVIGLLPADTWKDSRFYGRLVFPGRAAQLLGDVAPLAQGRVLAADSYASAALLAWHAGGAVPVFGRGTSHARQDDLATDWRRLAGRDLVVLRRERPLAQDYAPYFERIEIREIPLAGGVYHAVLGQGFDYAAYRKAILADIRERYYRIPPRLPVGRCYFFERYFPR